MTTNLSCTSCIHLRNYCNSKWCGASNNPKASVYRLISVEKQRSVAGRCGPERVLYKQDLLGKFFPYFKSNFNRPFRAKHLEVLP